MALPKPAVPPMAIQSKQATPHNASGGKRVNKRVKRTEAFRCARAAEIILAPMRSGSPTTTAGTMTGWASRTNAPGQRSCGGQRVYCQCVVGAW